MSIYGQYDVPISDIMVNLGVGQPRSSFLPLDLIKRGMQNICDTEHDYAVLQYGCKSGYSTFKQLLSNFISKQINDNVDANNLFITNGVTGAISLICSVFGNANNDKKGTVMIIEDPTYFLALNIFKDYKYNIQTVTINDTYVDQIKTILEKYPTSEYNVMLYTIPTFQNPTNYTMPDHIRKELVELTNIHKDFLIIADEVYQFLYFDPANKPPKPLYYYGGNVLSIGSFSKILCPALRLGWIQANDTLISKLDNCGIMESGGALNPIGCRIVESLLKTNDLDEYLNSCRNYLKIHAETMYNELKATLSEHCEFSQPLGGYFVWIKMKDPRINTKNMLDLAIKNKVRYHFGEKFSIANDANRYLRLSFSWYDVNGIIKGIQRLKQTIEETIQQLN